MLERLRQVKDKGLSAALRLALNEKLGRYGKITALRLDTGAHQLHVDVLLDGEPRETTLTVEQYDLLRGEDNQGLVIILGQIAASRPWLERMINDAADSLLDNRKLPVEHPALAKVLSMVL